MFSLAKNSRRVKSDCTLLDAALTRAAEGCLVHPLHAIVNGYCDCRKGRQCPDPGKHPRLRGYRREATRDPDRIRQWWEKWFQSNIGGVVPAGLVILDNDPRNGGNESLELLEAQHGHRPETVTVQTPRGGTHNYFTGNFKGKRVLASGLDLLGEGSNVVLAGSIGANGRRYEYELSSTPENTAIAPAPDWFFHSEEKPILTQPKSAAAIRLELPAIIHQGGRNLALTRYAGLLRYQSKEEPEILAALSEVNQERCRPPLPQREVEKIARYIGKKPAGKGRDTKEVEEARATINAITEYALSKRWRGKAGASRRRVLLSSLSIAHRAGTLTISASVRQIAEEAGLASGNDLGNRGLRRVIAHIHALCATGWLKRVIKGCGRKASVYSVMVPPDMPQSMPHTSLRYEAASLGGSLIVGFAAASHDTFRWQGLGKNAELVWLALGEKSYPSARQLALALSLSPDTAERSLKKLREHGLAAKDDRGGWHRGDGSLDGVAKCLGTNGKAEEQRKKHKEQRRDYLKDLDQYLESSGNSRRTHRLVTVPKKKEEEPEPDSDVPDPQWEKEFRLAA